MAFLKSFFTKTPATLDELHASVMTNESISFDIKNNFDLQYKMWKLLMSEGDRLLLNASTPINKFSTKSLNGLSNSNFRNLSSGFQAKSTSLLTDIPKAKLDFLVVLSSLNKQYPGIYEKMQQVLTDQSRGIIDSLQSHRKRFLNAKTRRNALLGKAAANALQTRLNSLRAGRRRKRQTKRR